MKVGDLVKDKTAVPLFGIGIVAHRALGGWWIHWLGDSGRWSFHIRTDLEVISASPL